MGDVFDAHKFRFARANMVPSSGSNLRAWAVAAAAVGDSDDQDSADEELDWAQRRREQKCAQPRGVPASLPSLAALPIMRTRRDSDISHGTDSGSDVEPIFIR